VFDDWVSSRVETLSEEDVEIFPSVPAAAIKTDTSETSEVMVETEKLASIVIDATVFLALLNIVEALEMDRDNDVVQMGNLRIENLHNVQKVQDYQYRLNEGANDTLSMYDKVTGLVLDSSQDNSKIQAKLAKLVESEIVNLGIDREELVGRLRETRHDVHDLKGRLSALELAATKVVDHSYTDEERSDILKLKFDLYDPRGALPRIVSELATISNKLESGGGVNVQGYAFSHDMDTAHWFKDHNGIIAIFVDGVAKLHAMIVTGTHTAEANRAKEDAKKIDMDSELEASITASFITVLFITVLPSILVGNMKEVTGGAYECLIVYLKTYSVWSPRVKTVASQVKKLRATVTTDADFKDLSSVLLTDSQGFITELCEIVSSQCDEYVESSSFTAEEAWSLVIDCIAHIFEELHSARSAVMDAGQYNQGMFLWSFLKAWEIQEHYRANEFKNDPALTGAMVGCIMMHDGERTLKQQLTQLITHGIRAMIYTPSLVTITRKMWHCRKRLKKSRIM
jgi:hypothetical protein